MNLNGKTALVTGASGGIGSAIAQKLSAVNCTVALAGRNLERLEEVQQSLLNDSIIVEMDVSQSNNVATGFEKTLKEFGKIDILVNAAGVMPLTYLKNRHLDEWLETIEVNVKGTLRCVHEVLPSMKDQKAGHIVNIASVDGQEIFQGGAVYGASKAAVIELSRAMRMELSPEFNIRVTSIEPGTVDTDLREDITDEELLEDKDYGGDEAKMSTEDIADAVYYALSQSNSVNVNELMLKPTGKS
ncbi:MAG: SDR family oxidoreductase [Christiangramia sp.]|uniref:SDR family oxidoreductase n=1 Tax=Christiangramia sp. TaxID=1931228 RepID=UPI0032424D2B